MEVDMNAECLLDYSLLAKEKEHEVSLLIKLKAPKAADTKRKALNLGLVLDRSGSMQGEKLQNTKEAARVLVKHLAADDILSVVTFESDVDTLIPPGPVTDKGQLRQHIDRIETGGCTNLSGGWLKGIEHVASKASPDYINRILLMTDGMANEGIVDPGKLAAIGASAKKEHDITTTTLGFGAGFQEDLLTGIAKNSGGNFYFIETADAAPEVFKEELGDLLKLVAQNVEVSVTLEQPVKLMKQWTDHPAAQARNTITFSLGDAYSQEEKMVLLGLFVPGLAQLGPVTVAKIEIRFAEISEQHVTSKSITQAVTANICPEDEAAGAEPAVEVLQQLGLQLSAKARKDAIETADHGDYDKAKDILKEAAQKLGELTKGDDPVLQPEVEQLKRRVEELTHDLYSGSTRKMMSTEAYNLSSSKYDKLQSTRERRRRQEDDQDWR
jgi:Ca-activated chloride channel family protein